MKTSLLIKELRSLPLAEQIYVIEKLLHSIRNHENYNSMEHAAEQMVEYYANDKELVTFTQIDFEDFYESR